jgi:hypothetical protein
MATRTTTKSDTVEQLYRLLKESKVENGVTAKEIEKIIYGDSASSRSETAKKIQIKRYFESLKKKYRLQILVAKGKYKLMKEIKGTARYDIIKCKQKIVDSIHRNHLKDYTILSISQYASKKGIQDYHVIALDYCKKNGDEYFKCYLAQRDDKNNQWLLKEEKLKRFYISNFKVIPKMQFGITLSDDLKRKIEVYPNLKTDDFGYAVKSETETNTLKFYANDFLKIHIKKYFLKLGKNKINSKKIRKYKKTEADEFPHIITIRYNKISNVLTLLVPYLDQIRFVDIKDADCIKKALQRYLDDKIEVKV